MLLILRADIARPCPSFPAWTRSPRPNSTRTKQRCGPPATSTRRRSYASLQNILRGLAGTPSADTLVGLVLVAFIDYRGGRKDGLRHYAQLARAMAGALNPLDEAALDFESAAPLYRQQLVALRTMAARMHQLAQ
jgi:hypothetical protein